jgi:hypothetical protein
VLFSSPEGFVEAARRLFFTTPGEMCKKYIYNDEKLFSRE